ncbi:MAG: cell envelope integrity protein TolA [Cytophagales bacterium]|nr:cell envelope integrity protein TolA [Rhizobacter sp.]
MPRGNDGLRTGLVLAALVHVALVIALAFSVSWHASEPEGVEAELWAAVPQIAAQRAVETEPPRPAPPKPVPTPKPEAKPEPAPTRAVPDPQIAIEKEKTKREKEKKEKEQDEKKRTQEEKLKADKAEAEKRKKEEARKDEQLAAQREANIKRILGEAGATGSAPGGKAAQTAGPSASYAGRVVARVRPNFTYVDKIDGNPLIEVEVRSSPNGTIVARKIVKSSGIARLDEAVLSAIDKTEMLPPDTDGRVPTPMVITFKPGDF